MRRTKIVATLGPATDDPKVLDGLIAAGVDVIRLNYSYGSHDSHKRRIDQLRACSQVRGTQVGAIADLQGPKIRIQRFRGGCVELREGASFTLDTAIPPADGDERRVGVTYADLPKDVKRGDTLFIDDGRIALEVKRVMGTGVECVVRVGGGLSDSKGLNRAGGGLSAGALTSKDRADIRHAVGIGADYIAVSFPRNAADIEEARRLIAESNGNCGVIAKVERAEALQCIDEILRASNGIMIARGDLGVEIGDAALPPVQKRLIQQARNENRLVITATQMMESMIENQIPTRAEVFDVANAVLDGTDAVMLSAETSVGKYPRKAVEAMDRICLETETQWGLRGADYRIDSAFDRIDEAIAMSTVYAANHIGAKAILALTETGATGIWMSRVLTGIPIFAFTRRPETLRRVTLYRGVYPIDFDVTHTDFLRVNREMIDILLERGAVHEEDIVVITKGDLRGKQGGTNGMKIVRVGELAAESAL
ncbi:MAG: pyruvate kinase [Chromatiales bacterium]